MPEHGGDASAEYRIRITDVTDRPQRRDDAQIERSDDNNQSSAASTPQSAETDPQHEYMSVDITNAEEVKAAAVGKQGELRANLSLRQVYVVAVPRRNNKSFFFTQPISRRQVRQ